MASEARLTSGLSTRDKSTPRKRKKSDASLSDSEPEEAQNDMEMENENESDTQNDIAHDLESVANSQARQKNFRGAHPRFAPRNIIHNFKFPVVLEDIGKPDASEKLADYDFDINRLMTIAQVGKIKTSKKISGKKYIVDCQSQKQRENILRLIQLRTPGGGYIPVRPRIPEPTTEGVMGPIGRNVTVSDLQEKIDDYNEQNPRKLISMENVFPFNIFFLNAKI